jgi:hypothetical protein
MSLEASLESDLINCAKPSSKTVHISITSPMYFAISCIIYQVVYWVKKGNKNNLKEKQCINNIELLFMKKHLTFSSFSLGGMAFDECVYG